MIEDVQRAGVRRSGPLQQEDEKVSIVDQYIKEGRILAGGCAEGKFLWALDENRWERHGIEFSTNVVNLVLSEIGGLHLIAGDLYANQLLEHSFDAITFWHVLEH